MQLEVWAAARLEPLISNCSPLIWLLWRLDPEHEGVEPVGLHCFPQGLELVLPPVLSVTVSSDSEICI